MGADKGKKQKVEGAEVDAELVLSIEKLQEIQDELEKVFPKLPFIFYLFLLHLALFFEIFLAKMW